MTVSRESDIQFSYKKETLQIYKCSFSYLTLIKI